MVATTALTEGVNLPVRTVVVAESGGFTKEGFKEYITGARLLNALGRAGRAAQETEGWLVLGLNARYDEEVFGSLRAGPDQNEVRSELLVASALEELSAAEQRVRSNDDALLEELGRAPRDFIAFVWGSIESLGQFENTGASEERSLSVVRATLAWQQASPDTRTSLEALTRATHRTYQRHPPEQRRRWAQSGMGIRSASRLERVVDDLYAIWQAQPEDTPTFDDRVWRALRACRAFQRALELGEAPSAAVFNQMTGKGRRQLSYSIDELVLAWVSGKSHKDIGDMFFFEVARPSYRLEQTVDLISRVVSSYLSWTIGTVLTWLGAKITDGGGIPLDVEVPAMIREGVNSEHALQMLRSGVHSRTFAHAAAQAYGDFLKNKLSIFAPPLKEWLAQLSVTHWQDALGASQRDLTEIFEFVRSADSVVASDVLEGKTVAISVRSLSEALVGAHKVTMKESPASNLVTFEINDAPIAAAHNSDNSELLVLARSGLPLEVTIGATATGCLATIQLASEEA